jgi:hypothetical protein
MRCEALIGLLQTAVYEDPDDWPSLTESTRSELIDAGLITARNVEGVQLTEKGRVFVAALEHVSLPIQKWVIPDADQEGG